MLLRVSAFYAEDTTFRDTTINKKKKNRTLAKMQPSETVRYTLVNIPSW